MNSLWNFGWDSIGAIFGILAFLVAVIGEWEKISKVTPKLIFFLVFFAFMGIAGFSLIQSSIIWRLASIIIGVFFGILLGTLLVATADETIKDKINRKISMMVFAGISGISVGLWIGSILILQ